MKPYRIKHIPTGLYYQPVKSGNSLGERGKVYLTNASPLSMNGDGYPIFLQLRKDSLAYKKVANLVDWKDYDYKSVTYRANKAEFVIEEL
jgi:hypothetical protein